MQVDHAPSRRVFSVPAYLGAVAAGALAMASIVALNLAANAPEDQMVIFIMASITGTAVGLLPALLLFLPATLFSLWLANRFALMTPTHFAFMGALSAVGTAVVVSFAFTAMAVPSQRVLPLPDGWALLAFAFAGAVAALAYDGLDLLSSRQEGSAS